MKGNWNEVKRWLTFVNGGKKQCVAVFIVSREKKKPFDDVVSKERKEVARDK